MNKNELQQIVNRDGTESYVCLATGHTMASEEGKTPNGNEFGGMWVLRDVNREYVGHDRFRTDLAGINNFRIGYDD